MYGKTIGTLNAATGIALLPDTGNNTKLFAIAATLLVSGVVIFVAATIMGRKSRQTSVN